MKVAYPAEWRPKSKWKRRFYSKYMTWLERAGYVVVILVIGAFIYAFNYKVDDLVSASKVRIEASADILSASEITKVVEVLSEDHAEVKSGEILLRYVQGEKAISQYNAWAAAEVLRSQTNDPTQIQHLAKFIKPVILELVSKKDGTLRISPDLKDKTIEPESELARVLDFNDLRMAPSLAGQTIASATSESPVQILDIAVEAKDGIIFRGSGTMPIVSGQLVDADFKEALKTELLGKTIKARDDRALEILDVTDVQLDATVMLEPATQAMRSRFLDPPTGTMLKGKVLSGSHSGTLQLASLPAELQSQLFKLAEDGVRGSVVTNSLNTSSKISDVSMKNMVLKVKAGGEANPSLAPIPSSSLTRTFDAQVQIESPPAYLVRAVRLADQQGKSVTAKVELKTGSRPIAFILLKKS